MSERLIAIHLHGPLADRFGAVHHMDVQTPREAVRALDANYPGFLAAFAAYERYGIYADDEAREGDVAAILPASRSIHFVPMIEGNIPFIAPLIATAFGIGTLSATIISGVLLTGLLIGISFLFRPKEPDEPEADERDESFVFAGPENVTGQGVAVPLIYGRVFAGSVVISAGQDVEQINTTSASAGASRPASASTTKPAGVPPPANQYSGLRVLERMIPDAPDPVGHSDEGAGIDHIRDELPPEGWPAIVADPVYGFRPEFWIPASYTWAADETDDTRKQVIVWQPDYETLDYVYNWNMVRGFYVTDVGIEQEEAEWIAGNESEVPVEEPAV